MVRLNIILLCIAIVCALSVVTSQHNVRKQYVELEKEQKLTRDLEEEWGRLQLEQSTWAMHSRIEAEAAQHLMMELPPHSRVQLILSQSRQDGSL